MSKAKPRVKNAVPLEANQKGKSEIKLLEVVDAFTLPESTGQGPYGPDQIIYVNHHGFEVPGHIIYDGKRYRTDRVADYDNLTAAVIALVRGQ